MRDAALKLQQWFAITSTDATGPVKEKALTAEKRGEQPTANKPLAFQLKSVDLEHPYLTERGISKDTAQTSVSAILPAEVPCPAG